MVRLYNQAQMFLFTPYKEPLGLVALEAMACGTPVVGIGEGGLRETIIDGVTGILTDRNPEEFAQAVSWMLAHPTDRDRMGQVAVEHIRSQWTWNRAVDHLESIFATVVAKPVTAADSG
jgi:glycosyltransferase involved in cell wall biosynthesis